MTQPQGTISPMPIEVTRDKEKHLTKHIVKGHVSEEEMYTTLENFYDLEPTVLLLWDMSQAELSHVTPDILKRFVKRASELGRSRRNNRTAVIAPSDLQYGLGRMSEVFMESESAAFSFRAFRSEKDAMQWLTSEV